MELKPIALALTAALLMGCAPANQNGDSTLTSSSTVEESVSEPDPGPTDVALEHENFSLKFSLDQTTSKYGSYLTFKDKNDYSIYSNETVVVNVRTKSTGIIETYKEETYAVGYDSFETLTNGYAFKATVETKGGSSFEVVDNYTVDAGVVKISRKVKVLEANESETGFSTTIRFKDAAYEDPEEYDYFMPAIIYKDTSNMTSGAIFSNVDLVGRIYVKETRTGLPMMYLRNANKNYAFSLAHIANNITVNGILGGGEVGTINDDLQYGSIGISCTPYKSVDFTYPCSEGPVTYDAGASWARRYHSVTVNNTQEYDVALYASEAPTYQDSMVDAYQKMYKATNTSVADINIDSIYEDNMKIFKDEFKTFGTGEQKYGGLPWSLRLPNGNPTQGYSSQMGFVGQQIPAAYQMYRYGLMNNDETTKSKALTALNFWASNTVQSNYFPLVWWDPADTDIGGTVRNYPSFLRCMVDGMEGLLDAYLISKEYGEESLVWKNAVIKFGNNLLSKQNANGSFCRAYNVNGSVNTDSSDNRFQGESQLNTPIAVRFLAKMYELTGENKYLAGVAKAAEFCYNELYLGIGKYVGGTPDNPNTVDKEAAVYAIYAFQSAYQILEEEKYLAAAEHAAVSAMSWVYAYDFAVPGSDSTKSINTLINGGAKGFSMIATGHSSADNYAAYIYYALFNMYVLTGEEVYKDFAYFIQNNTKLSNDYDGRMGFKYRALMPEATTIAEFAFASVGTWLPWSSVANLEPIVNMEKTYGINDVSKVNLSLESLRTILTNYGVGGIK